MTIEFDHVRRRFGAVQALDDLSFRAEAGRVTGLLGANGAGKTTGLRILLGLTRADAGTATIDRRTIHDLDHPARTVGASLETDRLHPGHRAADHLRMLALAGSIPARRVDEVLGVVGLADAGGRRIGGFSLGMKARLGLAAALLGDPSTIVLDEPTNGIDPAGIRWLRGMLRGYADDGRTVLVSSHLLGEVSQTVDDVVIVAGGRVVDAGPIERFGDSLEERFLDLTSKEVA